MLLILGIFLVVIIALSILILSFAFTKCPKVTNLNERHVVITGGSTGIGKEAAIEAAKLGAHVTIIGRDIAKLERAKQEIEAARINKDKQNIEVMPLDVTLDYAVIERTFVDIEKKNGNIYMLINCAGMAICGRFEDLSSDDMKYLMNLNYFGSAFPTKYVLRGMKERDEGIIVMVSSAAALLGIYGLSGYGASKWAVRGLGEALSLELVGTGVSLTISFPPDTDTPGFKNEEEGKPEVTKLICSGAGLLQPSEVAKQLLNDAMARKPYSTTGFDGGLMATLCCITVDGFWQMITQLIFMGPLRIIIAGYLLSFHRIVLSQLPKNSVTKNKDQ